MDIKTHQPSVFLVVLLAAISSTPIIRATSFSYEHLVQNQVETEIVCLNGGVAFQDQCQCPVSYTGTKCEVFLFMQFNLGKSKDDTKYHLERLRRSALETSGSGSGEEEVEEVMTCSNYREISIDGVCKIPTMLFGKTNLENETFSEKYLDRRTDEYKSLQKSTQDWLDMTFKGIANFEKASVKGFRESGSGSTVVYYALLFAPLTEEELKNMMSNITAAAGSENTINAQGFQEFNECQQINDCHSNATCASKVKDYQCTCVGGYVDVTETGRRPGSTCREICFKEDGSDFCENGDCNALEEGEYCTCRIGYAGTHCETYWFSWLITTIVLAVVLGVLLVVFFVSTIMMCTRRKWKKTDQKHDTVELNSTNGKGKQGVVNPYGVEEETAANGQNDKLTPQDEDDEL